MAKNIVRQDIVQIGFDVDKSGFKKLTKDIDSLKSSMVGINDGIEDIKKSVAGIGKEDGFNKAAVDVKKLSNNANKAADNTKELGGTDVKNLNNGLKTIDTHLTNIAKKASGAAYVGLKKLAGISLKSLVVGAGAISAAVVASVKAYGDYEQLVGGVDTLFKGSSATVQKYANDAYKTAGLSANSYMETITGFSASLLQSLGGDTAKAAEYAHTAVVDMSDNANKMGTSMDVIVDTYQSLARGNYEMLDNLKLGYGGTKTELQRLIKDAAKLDKSIDANSMSYANMVQAIHVIQEEMGITGTTSKEASTTIQGSFASMRSAWGNLMTSFVTGGDSFDQCIDNLIDSAETFGKNILPATQKALSGVGTFIERLAPYIESEFPKLVDTLLPPLIKAATSLLKGLIKAIPNIIKVVIKEFPSIARQFGEALAEAFGIEVPDAVGKGFTALGGILAGLLGFEFIAKKLGGISNFFGKSKGGKSRGGLFSSLAKMKTADVAKGLANLSIIVGGIGALVWIASKVFKGGVDFGELLKVTALIAILGAVGAGLSVLAGVIGKIPISSVALGLANMAIILAGIGALLFAATKVFHNGVNFKQMLEVITLIGILGTVGSILSVFAGIIGLVPIPAVLLGLVNMALVLGGISALIAAFGKLSEIPGFNEFITKGGETLANLFNQIGKIAGSLVGGFSEGITNSLPKIGENLSKFAESLKPMFSMFGGVDVGGIGAFFSAFGSFMLLMAGEKILSFFAGGTDLSKVGQQLDGFAHSAKSAFDCFSEYPDDGIKKAPKIFEAIKGIGSYNFKSGGLAQFFTGEVSLANIGQELDGFAHSAQSAFNCFSEYPDSGIEKAPKIFDAIDSIGKYDFKSGGLAQLFTGGSGLANIGTQLDLFAHSTQSAFNCFSEYPESGFAKLNGVVSSLQNLSATISSITIPSISGINSVLTTMISLVTSSAECFTSLGVSIVSSSTTGATAFMGFALKAITIMNQFVNAIKTKGNEAVLAVKDMLNKIKLAISSVNLFNSGANMIRGLINGINSKKTAAVISARSLATAVNTEFDKIQKMGSPSKVWAQKGKWLVEGGIIGMEKAMPDLQTTTQRAGEMALPYTPENTSSTFKRTGSVETNTYSPQFNLTISGSNEDRVMERRVKQWIQEAMNEVFDSMSRKNPRLREV